MKILDERDLEKHLLVIYVTGLKVGESTGFLHCSSST
jgi:hypothetical protein